jgi:hypothetical protein
MPRPESKVLLADVLAVCCSLLLFVKFLAVTVSVAHEMSGLRGRVGVRSHPRLGLMPTVAYDLCIMSKFNPGDHVERIDMLVPIYMKSGRVLSVLSHADSNEELTEYDVEFNAILTTIDKDVYVFHCYSLLCS